MKIRIDQINSFNLDISTKDGEEDHLLSDINVQYTMYGKGDKLVGNFKISGAAQETIQFLLEEEIENHFKRLYNEL